MKRKISWRLTLLMVLALLFLCRPEVLAGTPRHHPGYPGRKPELPGTGGLLFQGIPPDGGECVPLIAVQRTQCSTQDTFDEYVEQVRGSSFVGYRRGGGDGGELLTLVPKRSLCGGGLLFCPAALESLRPGGVEFPHTTLVI